MINLGKYEETYKAHINEIVLLVGDKHFPANYEELILVFSKMFQLDPDQILQSNNFNLVSNLMDLFYSLIKQQNRKRVPATRAKFLQYKATFVDMFVPFYEKIHLYFNNNSNNFTQLEFLVQYLEFMKTADKVLLILIDSTFSVSDFHKDEKITIMLKIIIDKANFVMGQLNGTSNSEIRQIFNKNIYKIMKMLSKIQSSHAILFYKELERYVQLIYIILINCNLFNIECIKVAFFAMYKVINTDSYKDLVNDDDLAGFGRSDDSLKTPEKSKNKSRVSGSGINLLVSPTKYKNFDLELQNVNIIFHNCFKEEVVVNLIETMIRRIPFLFKKESDNIELDLLADMEEEILPIDNFSANSMTFQLLYKNFLESLIINFPNFALKHIKALLDQLYSNSINNTEFDTLLIDSIINCVNLLPQLYKLNVIKETEMIDYAKFFNFVESLVNKNEILLKRYIVTISKWVDVLISYNVIYTYIDNLILFLTNSRNNVILLECCLAVKIIIAQIDKQLKGSSELNIISDKTTLENNVKTKINWSLLLSVISSVCLGLLPNVKSSELLLSLVNLFTILIQKCHFQCDGKILDVIQNSKITDVIQNVNDEFGQYAFIEMWKSLLISFPSSNIIAGYSLQYAAFTLKRELNINNLNFLLFTVEVLENTDEIRNLIINFLKDHIVLFQTPTKQYFSIILFNIFKELILFDIFDSNDIMNILQLCAEKYISLYEITKELQIHYFQNKKDSKNYNNNNDIMLSDLAEYKSSIVSVLSTAINFFYCIKGISIVSQCLNLGVLNLILDEVYLSKDGPNSIFSTVYLSSIVPLINRICIIEFEIFKNLLNVYLNEKGISFDNFFSVWLNRMEHMISIEAR